MIIVQHKASTSSNLPGRAMVRVKFDTALTTFSILFEASGLALRQSVADTIPACSPIREIA
jgi:hypothetical protein